MLVRARLVSSLRVRFTQYVPDAVKALLTVSKQVPAASTSTGSHTVLWVSWQVGSDTVVQTSVGVLRVPRERHAISVWKRQAQSLHI